MTGVWIRAVSAHVEPAVCWKRNMNNICKAFRISFNYASFFLALAIIAAVSLSYSIVNIKYRSDWIQNRDPLPEILSGQNYVQEIRVEKNGLESISLLLATFGRQNSSNVSISLSDSRGNAIMEWKLDSASLSDNKYRVFSLDRKLESRDETYYLAVTSDASAGNGITVWTSPAAGGLSLNGQDLGRTLCYRAAYRQPLSDIFSLANCLYASLIFVLAYTFLVLLSRLSAVWSENSAESAGVKAEQYILKGFCYVLIACCVFIRCYLYIYHKDLWLDECYIADAIYEASWGDLFSGHIPRQQSCPLLFAVVTKLLSYVTSYSPYVLYFFPTAAGILTAVLIYCFGKRLYGYKFAACGLTIYALSSSLLYYSSEFKPYIFDVLFTVILFGNLFSDLRKEQACRIFLGKKYPLLFAFAWLCSSTSIICSAAVGITIFFYLCFSRQIAFITLLLKLAKLYSPFVIFAALYYFGFLRQGASGFMYEFWKEGFIPSDILDIPDWVNEILKPVYYGMTDTIYSSTNTLSNILFWLAVFGLITVFCSNKYEFIAFVVLFALVAVLALKFYPVGLPAGIIGSRLILYILPVIIYLAAHGACSVINLWCRLQQRYSIFICILVFTIGLFGTIQSGAYYVRNRFHSEDSFRMYEIVSESYSPASDLIVAYSAAEPSFKYWKIFNSKLDSLPFVSIERDKLEKLTDDLFGLIGKDNYEGKKLIFFLLTHRDPAATVNVKNYFEEHSLRVRELKWIGAELLIIDLDK